MDPDAPTRCGFIALLGRPNVGKSTLLNRILGQKISITSPKPQTTRNQILGILTRPGCQAVFMDTPGMHRPQKELNRRMVKQARHAAAGCDLAAMLIEANRPWHDEDMITLELIEPLSVPKILVINKVDRVAREVLLPIIDHSARLAVFEEIVPLSAKKGDNVGRFVEIVTARLPEGPPHFPEDMVTDQAERFWAAEIVREKLVRKTREELPYSTAVVVEEFEERDDLIRIRALILVDRDSQKPMIIGRGGSRIKEIGTEARRDIEAFLGIKIFLELIVKVEKNWWMNPERTREMKLPG